MLNAKHNHAEQDISYNESMTMGGRIKENRLRLGLTQEQLGKIVGVSKVAVSLWESDTTTDIRLQTFLKVCEALGCDPHYLIFGPTRGAESVKSKQASR